MQPVELFVPESKLVSVQDKSYKLGFCKLDAVLLLFHILCPTCSLAPGHG